MSYVVKAYNRGYVDALKSLKLQLLREADHRLDDRQPFDLGSLSEYVMETINEMIQRQEIPNARP